MAAPERSNWLSRLTGEEFDIIVIGGGINGTSVARQFSHAGQKVLLVERNDFGGGSSSRSSRIMHCGLNYLAEVLHANGLAEKLRNVRLARRMMIERARLWRDLSGRLVPRPFVIPIRTQDAVRPWAYDLAFGALRALGGVGLTLDYKRYTGSALQSHPLRRYLGEDLVALVSFSELVFEWPEAVCHDYAQDAAAMGAQVLNYVAVDKVTLKDGRWRLLLEDTVNPGTMIEVCSRHVVNMAGIASDRLNGMAVEAGLRGLASRTVTPNKGCHAAIRLPDAFRGTGIIRRNELGHLFLAVPWRDYHIIGPTETVVSGNPPPPRAQANDIASLVAAAAENIPGATISTKNVLHHWAGYRPAGYSAENPRGQWLRRIHAGKAPQGSGLWLSMAWGRLADHRITARDVFRLIASHDGRCGQAGRPPDLPRLARRSAEERDHLVGPGGPRDLGDAMFGRLGLGWSADLGRSQTARVARLMEELTGASADSLTADFEALIREEFGAGGNVAGETAQDPFSL